MGTSWWAMRCLVGCIVWPRPALGCTAPLWHACTCPPPQGALVFDSLDHIGRLLEELPDTYASKQAAAAAGVDVIFSYANPIPCER